MSNPIDDSIDEFQSFLNVAAKGLTQKPAYGAFVSHLPHLLRFLQPVATRRQCFGAEAMDYFTPRWQRDMTSVEDEFATEKAVYFGVMIFLLGSSNSQRENYASINLDELSDLWISKADDPLTALEGLGFFRHQTREQFSSKVIENFLRIRIHPLVKDSRKISDARSYFGGVFASGVLLGQLIDALTVRAYYEKRDANKK